MPTIDQTSKANQEVIKIYGSLATLVKFATLENTSNSAVGDMFARILVDQDYTGDINVASNAFSSVYVAIRNTLGA